MKTLKAANCVVPYRGSRINLYWKLCDIYEGARRLNFAGRPIYIPEIQRATMIIARGDSAQIFSSSLSKVI